MSVLPASTASSLAQLVPDEPSGENGCIPLQQFPVMIARGEDAQFSFEDRWLSRRHCEIDCFDGQLIVRDLGSRHGTYINDMQIDESPLNINDQLRIGLTKFTVKSID